MTVFLFCLLYTWPNAGLFHLLHCSLMFKARMAQLWTIAVQQSPAKDACITKVILGLQALQAALIPGTDQA